MIKVTFTYQEKLESNEWGTERIISRIINGHEFKVSSPETNLPGWLQETIRRKLSREEIKLTFDLIKEVCSEFSEGQNAYKIKRVYLSQAIEITIRTKNENIHYYVK